MDDWVQKVQLKIPDLCSRPQAPSPPTRCLLLYMCWMLEHPPCAVPCLSQQCSKEHSKQGVLCTSTVPVEGCSPAEVAPTGGTVSPLRDSSGPDPKSAASAAGADTESFDASISHMHSQQQQAGVSTGLPAALAVGTSDSTMQDGDMPAAAPGPARQGALVVVPGEGPPSKQADDIIPASEEAGEEDYSDSMSQGSDGLHRRPLLREQSNAGVTSVELTMHEVATGSARGGACIATTQGSPLAAVGGSACTGFPQALSLPPTKHGSRSPLSLSGLQQMPTAADNVKNAKGRIADGARLVATERRQQQQQEHGFVQQADNPLSIRGGMPGTLPARSALTTAKGLHHVSSAPSAASSQQVPDLPSQQTPAAVNRRSVHKRGSARKAKEAAEAAGTPLGTVPQSQASGHAEPAQSQQISAAGTDTSGSAVSKRSRKGTSGAIANSSAAGPQSQISHQVRAVETIY